MAKPQHSFSWRDHLAVHPAAELFPLMSEAELKELANDIEANGLKYPIVVFHDDDADKYFLIDGRNRMDAMARLDGWLGPPPPRKPRERRNHHHDLPNITLKSWDMLMDSDAYRIVSGQYETDDLDALVFSLNVHRRHLTPEQKRELIAKVLKARPEKSNNQIAKEVKADDKTVAKVRADLESRSEIPNVETRTDTQGRKQPTKRKVPVGPAVQDQTVDFIGEHISTSVESAKIVLNMWSRVEQHDPEAAADVRDDMAAEIRALIIEWDKVLALVARAEAA